VDGATSEIFEIQQELTGLKRQLALCHSPIGESNRQMPKIRAEKLVNPSRYSFSIFDATLNNVSGPMWEGLLSMCDLLLHSGIWNEMASRQYRHGQTPHSPSALKTQYVDLAMRLPLSIQEKRNTSLICGTATADHDVEASGMLSVPDPSMNINAIFAQNQTNL
jgi:hypothetical protein